MGTEVVGPHVVSPLVLIKVVDIGISIDRPRVVMVVQGSESHVAINLVSFLLARILGDVLVKDLGVVVEVE